MNYKALILSLGTLAALGMPLLAQAWSSPDEVKVCYSFSGNTLKKTQSCILSSGGGAGGMYINIAVAGKNYPMEWSTLNENEKIYWNKTPMISYYRDGTFHHKLKSNELETANHTLSCYKTKNGSVDICHN